MSLEHVATSISQQLEEIVLHRPLPDGNEARVLLTINHTARRASIAPCLKTRNGEFKALASFTFTHGDRLVLWQAIGRLIAEAARLAEQRLNPEPQPVHGKDPSSYQA